MDHHTLATISISGSCLDALGSLYLAYDLLGGQHGPLRLLTRMVTYSVVFGLGFGVGFGLFFGLVSGIATGTTIAIELNRAAQGRARAASGAARTNTIEFEHYSLPWEAVFSAIRGTAFGAGLYPIVGTRFALLFAALVSAGPVFAYWRGMRPGTSYATGRRPRISRLQLVGAAVRTVGYTAAALICGAVMHEAAGIWWFAVKVGMVTGLVTALGISVVPIIEYYADSLPERRLGGFGIGLILCGFALQSVQYWLALFDVKVG